MGRGRQQVLPAARKEGIVVKELADEWLVYDLEIHKAHCLNRIAALVWKECDGRTSVGQIATILEATEIGKVDEGLVWLALEQLGKARLLEKRVVNPAEMKRISRREVIRKLGAAAAVPLVVSMVAPNASAALSCSGRECLSDNDCGVGCTCQGLVCA